MRLTTPTDVEGFVVRFGNGWLTGSRVFRVDGDRVEMTWDDVVVEVDEEPYSSCGIVPTFSLILA